MKRILLLAISLSLFDCSPVRRIATSDETVYREQVAAETTGAAASNTGETQTVTELERTEDVIIETTRYDTSQPVDPVTGHSPVREQTKQIRRVTTTIRQDAEATSHTEQQLEIIRKTVGNEERRSVVEQRERRGLNALQCVLCLLGAFGLAVGIGWLLWRYSNR